MKHRKFGREKNVRGALLARLTEALVSHGKIKTTEARAKTIRPLVERLVTMARRNDLASRRLVGKRIGPKATRFLVETLAPRYHDRRGGYTRITKIPSHRKDGARMAMIEFV